MLRIVHSVFYQIEVLFHSRAFPIQNPPKVMPFLFLRLFKRYELSLFIVFWKRNYRENVARIRFGDVYFVLLVHIKLESEGLR